MEEELDDELDLDASAVNDVRALVVLAHLIAHTAMTHTHSTTDSLTTAVTQLTKLVPSPSSSCALVLTHRSI